MKRIHRTLNIPELNWMNWPKQWNIEALTLWFLTFKRRIKPQKSGYIQRLLQKSMKLQFMNLFNALFTGSNVWQLIEQWAIGASAASRQIYHRCWWCISWAKFHHKNHHDRYIANEMKTFSNRTEWWWWNLKFMAGVSICREKLKIDAWSRFTCTVYIIKLKWNFYGKTKGK